MNCLEFRRIQLTHLVCEDPAFLRHRMNCSSCAGFAVREAQFEERLTAALQIPVPEFPSSILRPHSKLGRFRQHFRRRTYLALAASVLLTVGLALGLLMPERESVLQHAVIAEVNADREQRAAGEHVRLVALNALLDPFGMELGDTGLGKVTFADHCQIRDKTAVHVMFAGKQAPVSLLIMPGQQVERRLPLRSNELIGALMPIAGGSMALVSEPDEGLDAIESRVRSVLRLRI